MTHIRCPWHADFTCNVIVTLPAIGSYQPRFYSSLDIATRYRPGQVDLVTVPWTPEHGLLETDLQRQQTLET